MAKKKKATKAAAANNKNTSKENDISVVIYDKIIQQDITAANNKEGGNHPKLFVGAIDQGTSSTRFLLFTSAGGQIAASAQMEHPQIYPHPGWHEHDPVVLWQNTVACIQQVAKALRESSVKMELSQDNLACMGITNQRETTLAWNRTTGKPYYNAIVWDDTRTAGIAEEILSEQDSAAQQLTETTGLPVSSYFAGTKVKWLLDNVELLRQHVQETPQDVCFGTVDSWLLFQLTGQSPKSETTGRKLKGKALNLGGCFLTDVTNASRWLFMNIETCQWDQSCIETVVGGFNLLPSLPKICPSSHTFGNVADCGLPAAMVGVPLSAVLGDQQAALFGQAAHSAGQAKNTYGTGLFLMMNTGPSIVRSTHGLLTTVAYQLGSEGPVHYALEGSVSHSGSTIQWLRDQLKIIASAPESETAARTTNSNEGLYFVPAFAGLFAPHWRSDARGCIVGMTAGHHKGHICRAALEAAAYQTREVFDAIVKDTASSGGEGLKSLSVDGGGTNNKLLMQFQADIINVPVVKPVVMETTALGAAFAAGLAVGVWKDLEEIQKLWAVAETYEPKMTDDLRNKNFSGWKKAVTKSLGWIGDGNPEDDKAESLPVKEATTSSQEEKSPDRKESLKTDNGSKEGKDATTTVVVPEAATNAVEGSPTVTTSKNEAEAPKPSDSETNASNKKSAEDPVNQQEKAALAVTVDSNRPAESTKEEEDDTNSIVHIGEVNEVSPHAQSTQQSDADRDVVADKANPVESMLKRSFTGQTTALTAGAALVVGIILGGARNR